MYISRKDGVLCTQYDTIREENLLKYDRGGNPELFHPVKEDLIGGSMSMAGPSSM